MEHKSKSRRSRLYQNPDSGMAPPRQPSRTIQSEQPQEQATLPRDSSYGRSIVSERSLRGPSPGLTSRNQEGGPELLPDSRIDHVHQIEKEKKKKNLSNLGQFGLELAPETRLVRERSNSRNEKNDINYDGPKLVPDTGIASIPEARINDHTSDRKTSMDDNGPTLVPDSLVENRGSEIDEKFPPRSTGSLGMSALQGREEGLSGGEGREERPTSVFEVDDQVHNEDRSLQDEEVATRESPPCRGSMQHDSQTIVATPVMEDSRQIDTDGDDKAIAVAREAEPWYQNKKLWAVAALLILCLGGGVAGIIYATTEFNNGGQNNATELIIPEFPPVTDSPTFSPGATWKVEQLGQPIYESNLPENLKSRQFGHALALSGDGLRVAVISPLAGSIYIYDLNATQHWEQTAMVQEGRSEEVHHVAISRSGSVVALGFPKDDEAGRNAGVVFLFQEVSPGDWSRFGEPIYGESPGDCVGGDCEEIGKTPLYISSIALSYNGRVVAVGSPDGNYVKVLKLDKDLKSWSLVGNKVFRGSGGFGASLQLSDDGTRLIVSAPYKDGIPDNKQQDGQVRVYEFSTQKNSWKKLGQDFNGISGDVTMGSSIGISTDGRFIMAGAFAFGSVDGVFEEERVGLTRIYRYISDDEWYQVGNTVNFFPFELGSSETAITFDGFPGYARMAGNGKRVAISHPLDRHIDIRLYEIQDNQWEELVDPIAGVFDKDPTDESVGLGTGDMAFNTDGSILAVGSPLSDRNGEDNGEIRVFRITRTNSI